MLGVLALAGVAVQPAGEPAPTLAIVHATVIDVLNGQTTADSTVVVRGDLIVSVEPRAAAPKGAQVVDARGRFLIPGLWDMHAHHEATGEASLALYLANGVTGTRDMGSDLDTVLGWRAAVHTGTILGPRIVTSGPILDDAPADWPYRMRVRSADDGRRAVRFLRERGVDFVKVHDRTPRDAYFAIADEAKRLNLPLVGHLPRGISVEEAVDAGQQSVEHLAGFRMVRQCSDGEPYRREPCAPFFAWLAKHRIWQTPTLASWRGLMTIGTPQSDPARDHLDFASPSLRKTWALNQGVSSSSAERARELVRSSDNAAVAVSDMQQAGVGILAGCDGLVPGFCVHDELALMVRGGMTTLAALQTATINPARFLGREDSLGTVAPGKTADLVLLRSNPLRDIRGVGEIDGVVTAGRWFDRKRLDSILTDVRREFGRGSARLHPPAS
jgi:imidazolonepropionase-like amidohydrolase